MPALHAHLIPGTADDLGTLLTIELLSHISSDISELDEGAPGRHAATVHGLPPDLTGLLPGVATKGNGRQVEGPVGDTAVQMHAAIVLNGGHVAGHAGRLRVFALFMVR